MIQQITRGIKISVESKFEGSFFKDQVLHHAFMYHIKIENQGKDVVQLLSRHWIIEDANGKVQNVKGEGVVGDQPYINPGDEYQYTSGTVLETSLGTMKGTYQMINDSEKYFDAEIPEFVLTIPRVIH